MQKLAIRQGKQINVTAENQPTKFKYLNQTLLQTHTKGMKCNHFYTGLSQEMRGGEVYLLLREKSAFVYFKNEIIRFRLMKIWLKNHNRGPPLRGGELETSSPIKTHKMLVLEEYENIGKMEGEQGMDKGNRHSGGPRNSHCSIQYKSSFLCSVLRMESIAAPRRVV